MKVVQIGSNCAKDDLTKIIKKSKVDLLILVEPLHYHNANIQNCYSYVNNKFIENIAITVNNEVETNFYVDRDGGPLYEVSSLDINHLIKHGCKIEKIKKLKVKCLHINQLFEKYNITDLDILYIDAEGIDDLILKSIDFNKINISKIYFENLHITQPDVYTYLENKGYKIKKNIGENSWTDLAEK